MQIKYRITFVYTIIVAIVLLLLCTAIYLFSQRDRENQFKDRLVGHANSIALLIKTKEFDPQLVKQVNMASPSSLYQKSIYVFDESTTDTVNETFSYNDKGAEELDVTKEMLDNADPGTPRYFEIGDRNVAVVKHQDKKDVYTVIVAAYDKDSSAWLSKLRIILLACFLFSIGTTFVSGYIFSLSLVKSISKFTQKIKHISSEKFSMRLETGSGKDELQKLAITINDLLDRLQSSFNTQRRFIDNASHELSTPLASISSQLDVTLQRDRSSEEYKRAFISLNDDVKHLSLLVRSLLEMAKVSGSAGGTELASVRIDELLLRLPPEMKKISPFYDVNIEFGEFPDDENALVMFGNEHLLYSAIKNIVHNACKFAEDKRAQVKLNFTNKNILISIHDNGPGIEPEEIQNIFQPFYRSRKHNNYVAGSGLGLSLANRIIKLHKGDMEIRSELGKGTTFIIMLPVENVTVFPL